MYQTLIRSILGKTDTRSIHASVLTFAMHGVSTNFFLFNLIALINLNLEKSVTAAQIFALTNRSLEKKLPAQIVELALLYQALKKHF